MPLINRYRFVLATAEWEAESVCARVWITWNEQIICILTCSFVRRRYSGLDSTYREASPRIAFVSHEPIKLHRIGYSLWDGSDKCQVDSINCQSLVAFKCVHSYSSKRTIERNVLIAPDKNRCFFVDSSNCGQEVIGQLRQRHTK